MPAVPAATPRSSHSCRNRRSNVCHVPVKVSRSHARLADRSPPLVFSCPSYEKYASRTLARNAPTSNPMGP